ncbi:serine/threonine-protein kinase [Streptomyces xanthophaeus]|uniref:serine/threonine-protein kinase n=1 Tax=Streptomyces xanthophaeus TaxID=67385 RepID=UPI0036584CD6
MLELRGSGAEPLEPEDPRRIGPIPLAGRLGAGGMGRVYLGVRDGRYVAVKQLLASVVGEDKDFLRRFGHELDNLARLPDGATAPLLASDRTARPPWFATAYVPGITLKEAVDLHGEPLPAQALWLLLREAAAGLEAVHALDMVHRDLKPSNVMLTLDGLTLIDFGVARAAEQSQLTRTGMVVGTPAYMAPEQASGTRRLSGATDVFALGSVLAYAACGRPPFGDESGHGVLYRIVHEEPDLSAVPERLRDLVTRCLDKDPEARPSISEVIALCQSANAETVLRRPEDWLPGSVAADITVRAAAPAPVQTPPPPATAPSVAYSPTTPVAPAAPPTAPPAAPATPPPGFGPAVVHQPTHPTGPQPAPGPSPYSTPAPGQGHAYAPTQVPGPAYPQAYPPRHPGHPGHPVPPAPQPPRSGGRKRGTFLALAAALVFAVAGSGTAYVLLKDNGTEKSAQPGGAGSNGAGSDKGNTGDGGSSSGSADPKQNAKSDPKPADYKAINLTAGYHLTLGDDSVRPQQGEDGGYELSYDTGGYLDAESHGGNLVLLDPGQEGSLATCRAETRFTQNVYVNKLSKGRQVCVTTGSGHLGLVTVQGFSGEDSPSKYMTLDVTVWRNAVSPGASS